MPKTAQQASAKQQVAAKHFMNDLKPIENKAETKPGFFTRILNKMDNKMKAKADEAAKNQCCSPNDKGKGGKCC